MNRKTSILLGVLGASTLATPALADTYNICVKVPVTIADETGMSTDFGLSGDWKARGIYIESMKYLGWLFVQGVPQYADPNTGCFSVDLNLTSPASYTLTVQSQGLLTKGNRLQVHNSSGVPSSYSTSFTLSPGGGTYNVVWGAQRILLRMYAIYAYAHVAFSGRYDNEFLHVWWYPDNATNTACNGLDKSSFDWNNDVGHVCIRDSSDQRKFLMVHEYGHINLEAAIPLHQTDDCTYGAGHGMRSIEYNSCGAMEGWASFVATDVWNTGAHGGGTPPGWLRYWDDVATVVNVASGAGNTCAAVKGDDSPTTYRDKYGDDCIGDPNSFGYDPAACPNGDCDGYAVELDWLRTWWDYHTDDSLAGSRPGHWQLHTDVDAAGGWSSTDFWDQMLGGLSGQPYLRLLGAGNRNGSSEP